MTPQALDTPIGCSNLRLQPPQPQLSPELLLNGAK